MTLKYLIDTNTISEPVRETPNLKVLRKMKLHSSEMGIPSIVWHELLFGVERLEKSKKRERLEFYLNSTIQTTLPILNYDEKAALWHAQERARLQKLGLQVPFADAQIAAIAYTNQLILVTRNEPDFKHFKKLKVENWF